MEIVYVQWKCDNCGSFGGGISRDLPQQHANETGHQVRAEVRTEKVEIEVFTKR